MKNRTSLVCGGVTGAFLAAGLAAHAADVGQDAIDACIDGLRAQGGGGGGQVLSTEFSEANSLVMLQDAGGTTWRCLVSNDGRSAEVTMAEAGTTSAGFSGPSHWEVTASTLNIHSSPSTSAPTVGRLPRGAIVENRGCLDEGGRTWCEVADGDASGWAAQEFLMSSDGTASRENTATADDGGGAMAGASTSSSEVVHFGGGRTGTDLTGQLTPGSSKSYVLGAADGQTLYVEFWTTDPAIEYQIFLPNGKTLLDMMPNTQRYEGSLFMNGDHKVEVINRSNATASYNMSVEIR